MTQSGVIPSAPVFDIFSHANWDSRPDLTSHVARKKPRPTSSSVAHGESDPEIKLGISRFDLIKRGHKDDSALSPLPPPSFLGNPSELMIGYGVLTWQGCFGQYAGLATAAAVVNGVGAGTKTTGTRSN